MNTMIGKGQLICGSCGHSAAPLDWCCGKCQNPLELSDLPPFNHRLINQNDWSLWRYSAMLPVPKLCSLGEGFSPLIRTEFNGTAIWAKLEYLAPTLSYKDRGTAILINHLIDHGVQKVRNDSSGNAGVSLAAYATAAGIQATIYVPDHASPVKKHLIRSYGATCVEVGGSRAATTNACLQTVDDAVYTSHAWNPFFIAGQMTCAWEIWEQLGQRVPDAVICVVGQGNLLLGQAWGYAALKRAGLITHIPKLFAVQARVCAPLARAWEQGSLDPLKVEEQLTIAEGIQISSPVRGRMVLQAIRSSGGAMFQVDDREIKLAQQLSAQRGILIEPTSAAAIAALPYVKQSLGYEAEIVIPLSGSGVKALTHI